MSGVQSQPPTQSTVAPLTQLELTRDIPVDSQSQRDNSSQPHVPTEEKTTHSSKSDYVLIKTKQPAQ